MKKAILGMFVFVLVGFGSIAQADQCPKLTGKFHCPPRGQNPAFDMVVTQVGNPKTVVKYSWEYTQPFQAVTYLASLRGAPNDDGLFGVCRNRGLYLTKKLNDLSNSLRNEVNLKGNYIVTTFMGEPVLTCLRYND